MIELRPYQIEALQTVMADLREERFALLQAATGAGKTIIFSELIRQWMTEYPAMRIGIAAHRQELITQARDKLVTVWPEGRRHIGLACAGVGRVDVNQPVVIGSVQTLARRALRRPIHLLIIDEAHRVPALKTDVRYPDTDMGGERPVDGVGPGSHPAGGQYHDLVDRLSAINPGLRVLGVTATPFRLSHGYIYGNECKPGHSNLWPRLNYQITLDDLVAGGHLSPIRAKEAVDMGESLAGVRLAKGEYDQGQLGDLLSREVHIQSAVEAYEKYGEGRDKVLAFAVTIEHAVKLAEAFARAGHPAEAVHSNLHGRDRQRILASFDHGGLKVLVNVGILTEGWDSPRVNCILMCRPTKAPALFVQMIGRGTRLHPGKTDLLVLDLANNFRTHGDPSDPEVEFGSGGSRKEKKPEPRVCPICQAIVPVNQNRCWSCGHVWQIELTEKTESPEMVEIRPLPPGASRVESWWAEDHVSQKGNYLMRLVVKCRPGNQVWHFLDFDGTASAFGRKKARILWWQLTGGGIPPESVREALARQGELRMPEFVTVVKDNGYKRIKEFG